MWTRPADHPGEGQRWWENHRHILWYHTLYGRMGNTGHDARLIWIIQDFWLWLKGWRL